jgi:short-subunit dehydrogenase
MSFAERYGPWAVVAGASEGTGRSFARKIAARGVPCVLLARREGPLQALAEEIRAESGITCVTAAIDLAAPDALDRLVTAVGARDVGLFVSNAGSDPNGARFLDRDVAVWLELVQRGVVTLLQCCHHFGTRMRARGKGGLLLVNSGACYGGGSFLATYSATKAFMLSLSEGLWTELRPHGVDVLTLILGMTDTPEFRRLLAAHGQPVPPNIALPDDVAEIGLSRLSSGPVHNWGAAEDELGFAPMSASTRRSRVLMIDAAGKRVFDKH